MKRNGGILALLTIMFSSLVSAGPVKGVEQLANGARDVITIFVNLLSDILFDLESFDELFFAKFLILLIIFFIVYTVLSKNKIFGTDKKIVVIITSAISILSVKYLPVSFVQAILLQYSVFAISITTILPFMIFFFFLHQSGIKGFGRRAGWLIYGASFIAMWMFRYDELGDANFIFWIGTAFVVIAFLFDKSIHKYFKITDFRKIHSSVEQEAKWKLQESAELYAQRLAKGIMTPKQYREKMKDISEQIKQL